MFDVDDTRVGSEMSNLLMVFLRNNSPLGLPRGTEGNTAGACFGNGGLDTDEVVPRGGDMTELKLAGDCEGDGPMDGLALGCRPAALLLLLRRPLGSVDGDLYWLISGEGLCAGMAGGASAPTLTAVPISPRLRLRERAREASEPDRLRDRSLACCGGVRPISLSACCLALGIIGPGPRGHCAPAFVD